MLYKRLNCWGEKRNEKKKTYVQLIVQFASKCYTIKLSLGEILEITIKITVFFFRKYCAEMGERSGS